jgi:hypothetical protein
MQTVVTRRQMLVASAAALAGTAMTGVLPGGDALSGPALANHPSDDAAKSNFQLRYLLGSCMYGYTSLGEILPVGALRLAG